MAVVVVGGHSRDVGKTSVVAGLIRELRDREWTAVKITQFGHGICSTTAEPCECSLSEDEHAWDISQETSHAGDSDTSRFLAAGAARALWVRTRQGMLAEAMPALRKQLASAGDVIIESNSVMRFLRPDLYLPVLNFTIADFKDSAREFLDRASALVVSGEAEPQWDAVSLKPVKDRVVFRVHPPEYMSAELADFVRRVVG